LGFASASYMMMVGRSGPQDVDGFPFFSGRK
jgi:hypothetical protein